MTKEWKSIRKNRQYKKDLQEFQILGYETHFKIAFNYVQRYKKRLRTSLENKWTIKKRKKKH